MTMFLAMLLSVARTIVIMFPLRKHKKRIVVEIISVYIMLQISHDVLNYTFVSTIMFSTDEPHCHWHLLHEASHQIKLTNYIFLTCETEIPPTDAFFSFAASIVKLTLKSSSESAKSPTKRSKIQAAQSVTLFTPLFLLNNLPYFTLNVLDTWTVAFPRIRHPGPIFSISFMRWYIWAVGKVLF